MRIYHFSLIFIILAVAVVSLCENRLAVSDKAMSSLMRLDTALDRACDAAAGVLAGEDESDEALAQRAEEAFVKSLCAYYGIDPGLPDTGYMIDKAPVYAITGEEGALIGYLTQENGRLVRRFTERISYADKDLRTIMEEYCNRYDSITEKEGVYYRFDLPDEDTGLFGRNSKGTGFAVLYRGEDGYSFAYSVLKERKCYYINLYGDGYSSPKYYHSDGCGFLNGECTEHNSMKECALMGAYPCPVCVTP